MTNLNSNPDKTKRHDTKHSAFSTLKPCGDWAHLSDFPESVTQPRYYTYEEWNKICTCECHQEIPQKSEDNVEDISENLTKIDKNINDHIKGEPYCQSGQEECKMPNDCKWHNSSFASDYYRYRQDSIPKLKPSTPPSNIAVFRNKNTTQSPLTQTLCCIHHQQRIARKIPPTMSTKELKEVYQHDDKENSANNRFKQKPMLQNTAYGIQWKNEKPYNKNNADLNKYPKPSYQLNSDGLLDMKLSLLDKYLQSQFKNNQNYLEECNTSPDAIYEIVMDQIVDQSVELRSIKIEDRTPSVSPPLCARGEITPDHVGSASDADDSSVTDKAEYFSEHHVSYRNPLSEKRTISISCESSSSTEQTYEVSSDSNEQTNCWITPPKNYDDLQNCKLKVIYENPFLHGELFDLAQNDQNMNRVINSYPIEIKSETVDFGKHLNDAVTVDEGMTIVVTSSDGVKVVAPYQSKMARSCVNVVQRTEQQELERLRKNLACRISRARGKARNRKRLLEMQCDKINDELLGLSEIAKSMLQK